MGSNQSKKECGAGQGQQEAKKSTDLNIGNLDESVEEANKRLELSVEHTAGKVVHGIDETAEEASQRLDRSKPDNIIATSIEFEKVYYDPEEHKMKHVDAGTYIPNIARAEHASELPYAHHRTPEQRELEVEHGYAVDGKRDKKIEKLEQSVKRGVEEAKALPGLTASKAKESIEATDEVMDTMTLNDSKPLHKDGTGTTGTADKATIPVTNRVSAEARTAMAYTKEASHAIKENVSQTTQETKGKLKHALDTVTTFLSDKWSAGVEKERGMDDQAASASRTQDKDTDISKGENHNA